MKTVFQHPTTVSSVSVDPVTGKIATACFDGLVRVFGTAGEFLSADKKASQLNAVAIRNSTWICDDDLSTLKTGVAIAPDMTPVRQSTFTPVIGTRSVTAIDRTGLWCVTADGYLFNRAGQSWGVGSMERTPMGVEVLPDGHIVTVGLDGHVRVWSATSLIQVRGALITPEGLNSVDVSADGKRLVVTDWNRGITLLDAASLAILYRSSEQVLIHSARFGKDGSVYYGTHDGRLCQWDGASPIIAVPTAPAPTGSKPAKGRK